MANEVQSIDDTYFDSDQVNTDYFEEELVKKPAAPVKASEAAIMTSVLAEGDLNEVAMNRANEIESNFLIFNEDPTHQQVVTREKNQWKEGILQAGPQALIDTSDAPSLLQSIDEALKVVDKLPERPLLVTSTAEKLANPVKDYGFLFEDVMAQVMVDQSLSDMIVEAEDKVEWTFGDWAGLLTVSPVTERAFRSEVLDEIGLYEGATDYTFRAPHAARVADWIRNAPTAQDTKERLSMFLTAAMEEGDNGIYSSAFLTQVKEQLEYANDDAAVDDIFELFIIADIKDIGRGLKYLATKALTGISKRSGRVDSKAISDAESVTKEVVDSFLPRKRHVVNSDFRVDPVAAAVGTALPPLRTGVDSLLDTVYKSHPELVGGMVKSTAPEDLGRVLEQAGTTPENVAMRFFSGNGTEGRGMHISWLTGSDSAMPLISPYSNTAQDILNQVENTARQSLYTRDEMQKGVNREVDELRRASNGVLQPQSTKIVQMSDESDELLFQVQFGKTHDQGYGSIEEAQFAASRLMGVDNGRIVARVKGSGAPAKPLDEVTDVVHKSSTGKLKEIWTRPDGSTYELYQTGKTFRSVVTHADGTIKRTNHKHLDAAEKNKWRKIFDNTQGVVKKTADEVTVADDLEYFVEATARHTMVHMDANVFGSGFTGAGLPLMDWVIPYAQRINDDMFNTITSFVGRGDAVAAKMVDLLKPLRKLKGGFKPGSEGEAVNNLLVYGDQMGIVFTRQKAQDYLGGRLNDRIWNAYKASRDYFDIMHDIRNKREYLSLHGDGHKSIVTSDGKVLEDAKGAVFGRPISKSELSDTPYIMDESGDMIKVTDELYDEVESTGGAIIKTHREVTKNGEDYFEYVRVSRTDQVKPLTHTPMPKRTGHVDLMYRPEDSLLKQAIGKGNKGGIGATVKMKRSVTLNGRASEREDTIGIFANEAQANEWIALRDPDGELGLYSEMTRERAGMLGLSDTTDMSGIPTHALGRGERLTGPKGPAEVMNPIEVMETTVGEIRRTLNADVIDLLKSRFMAKYAGMVTDPSKFSFPASVEELATKFRKENSKHLPEATELFKFIRNQEIGLTGRINSKYMDMFLRYANSFYTKDGGNLSLFGRLLEEAPGRKTIALMAKANQLTAIAGRVLFQAAASAVQAWTLFARDPVLFGRTVSGSIATVSGLLLRKMKPEGADELMKFFGWMNGMDGPTFSRYLEQISESGITNTDISDDIISLLLDATKVQAGNLNVTSAAFWKNLPRYSMKALTMPMDASIILNKVMGYVHATNMYRRDGGAIDSIFSNAGRDRIRGDMDKLTFTQSRTDQLAYQQNSAKVMFQFMHHVHKMFLGTFVMPVIGTLRTGAGMLRGNFKLSEKISNNIYANTKAQALTTFGMTIGMFGAGSVLPDKGANLREMLDGYPPEVRVAIVDGMFNLGFHQWMGETFNISERFAAMDFHTQFMDFVLNDDFSVNVLGPSSMLFDNLAKVKDWIRVHHDNEAMTSEEFFDGLGDRTLRLFAGYRDWEKAEIARNLGTYTASNGMSIMDVNPDAYWPIMLSLAPSGAGEYYGNQEYIKNETDFVFKVVDSYTMDFASWAAQNPMATPDEIQDEIVKMYKWTEAALGQTRIERIEIAKKRLASFLINPDEPAVARQIKSLFQMSSDVHEAMRRLERMNDLYPELVDDHLIQMLKEEYESMKDNQ